MFKSINNFSQCPLDQMTPSNCLAAVRQNGLNLRYVPEHLKSNKVCSEAVFKHASAFTYVPISRMSPKLCLMAVIDILPLQIA